MSLSSLKKPKRNIMLTGRAFEIVYELALDNAISKQEVLDDVGLRESFNEQHEALNVVHDFLINKVFG